jgi:hypothetical protein
MHLSPDERAWIERLAEAQHTSMKEAVLDAVRRRLQEVDPSPPDDTSSDFTPTGRLRGAEHLIGSFDGPSDLSTSDHHLDGYGE